MRNYLIQRLLLAVPTVVGVTVLIFLAMRVIPGDPLRTIVGEGQIYILSDKELANVRHSLGLDKPLPIQYLAWMRDVLKGDLGYSFWQKDISIRDLVVRRGPLTLEMALMATAISWTIGIPAGVIAALRRNSSTDYGVRLLVTLFMAIPNFWLALTIVLTTVIFFEWRPPVELASFWKDPWTNLQMAIGPAVAMGTGFSAIVARMSRSSLLEVLREDYIRTARAKGLRENLVVVRHGLRNAILPVVTLSGMYLGAILGGSVAVERAFSVPGLGYTLIYAVEARDWMVIQNLVLIFALAYVFINMAVDIAYGWIDPRIRYG